MGEMSTGLGGRCGYCGANLAAKTTRRRFCGDGCRWAAWKQRREREARAPVERALLTLIAKVEEAVEEAREALLAAGSCIGVKWEANDDRDRFSSIVLPVVSQDLCSALVPSRDLARAPPPASDEDHR